jgi:hypothetical protein
MKLIERDELLFLCDKDDTDGDKESTVVDAKLDVLDK